MTVVTAGLDQVTEQFEPASPGKKRSSWLLTVIMIICLGYFLLPLFWLVVASTKSNADLFSSFGLWFANFNLMENIQTVLNEQGALLQAIFDKTGAPCWAPDPPSGKAPCKVK